MFVSFGVRTEGLGFAFYHPIDIWVDLWGYLDLHGDHFIHDPEESKISRIHDSICVHWIYFLEHAICCYFVLWYAWELCVYRWVYTSRECRDVCIYCSIYFIWSIGGLLFLDAHVIEHLPCNFFAHVFRSKDLGCHQLAYELHAFEFLLINFLILCSDWTCHPNNRCYYWE